MGFACPVCEIPQQDATHLANHLAFTAMVHGDEHEAWLDEHVDDWSAHGEAELAPKVAELAAEADYEQVFEDTAHAHDHGNRRQQEAIGGEQPAGIDPEVAAAEVLYPSAVTGHEAFVETYVNGRVSDDPDHRAGLLSAVAELDAIARDWHGDGYADLARETRDRLLRDLGVDVADPDPDGPISSRLRWYVVNDLLYAFYTSPTGGRLVGTENPTGYPGGTESYQRGPEALDDG